MSIVVHNHQEVKMNGSHETNHADNPVVGVVNPEQMECCCRKCAKWTRDWVPIKYNEINYQDNIRCTQCGHALLEPPSPRSFALLWEQRRELRAGKALGSFEAEKTTQKTN